MSEEEQPSRSVHMLMTDPARAKPEFVAEAGMDKTISAVMRLAMEISVLRDRLDTHEALAQQSGLSVSHVSRLIGAEESQVILEKGK